MPAPARVIIDRLYSIKDDLLEREQFAEALEVEVLVESANRESHISYTWDGVSAGVLNTLAKMDGSFGAETVEKIRQSLDFTVNHND